MRNAVLIICMMLCSPVFAQELLFHHDFNEGPDAHWARDAQGKLDMQCWGGEDPRNAKQLTATGVSGKEGDWAFDGTAADRMGGNGHWMVSYANDVNIPTQKSFTISGWFKTDENSPIDGAARFVQFIGGAYDTALVLTAARPVGSIALTLSSKAGGQLAENLKSDPAYTETGEWVFFAVSYDGSIQSGDNVRFYKGTATEPVSLVSSGAAKHGGEWGGMAVTNEKGAAIGGVHSGQANRCFDGYLDDFRMHGSQSGGAGALSAAALEALRQESLD